VLPDDAGMGATPARHANAASERIRPLVPQPVTIDPDVKYLAAKRDRERPNAPSVPTNTASAAINRHGAE
jgi:hypothetical protein